MEVIFSAKYILLFYLYNNLQDKKHMLSLFEKKYLQGKYLFLIIILPLEGIDAGLSLSLGTCRA